MEDKQTYLAEITTYQEVEVDFKKIYDALVAEYPDLGTGGLYETFGDNIEYYLREVLNLELEDSNALDDIWTDFGDWLDERCK